MRLLLVSVPALAVFGFAFGAAEPEPRPLRSDSAARVDSAARATAAPIANPVAAGSPDSASGAPAIDDAAGNVPITGAAPVTSAPVETALGDSGLGDTAKAAAGPASGQAAPPMAGPAAGPISGPAAVPGPAAEDSASRTKKMTFAEALDRLLQVNPEIRKARQVWLAARDKYHGSFGVFEPSLVGSWEYQETDRPHLLYAQTQSQYTGGIEGVLPSATKYNVGFSFTDLSNKFLDNVNRPTAFSGITLTQPLLQGLWFGKPVAEIKAARADQLAALNRFRATLCATISELHGSYWKLRYAQDKLLYARQSVAIAQELVADSRVKFRVGKISQVETVEAAAGLASRQAAVSGAQMELNTAISELHVLISGNQDIVAEPIEATSKMQAPPRTFLDSLATRLDIQKVLNLQPDFLQKKFETQKQKVAYDAQADQCLPELTLKGTWGYQVTGTNSSAVWNNFTDDKYRSNATTYSAGVEVRFPLGLNIKERNAKSAEKHALRQAEIDQHATRSQLENYVRVSIKRLNELRSNIDNAAIVVDYRQTLLQAEIGRQKAGKSDYHKIFDIEDDLTKAKLSELENTVEFLSTQGQFQRLTGTTLVDLNLETIDDDVPVLAQRIVEPANGQ
jgi:outer membrane protein TolC